MLIVLVPQQLPSRPKGSLTSAHFAFQLPDVSVCEKEMIRHFPVRSSVEGAERTDGQSFKEFHVHQYMLSETVFSALVQADAANVITRRSPGMVVVDDWGAVWVVSVVVLFTGSVVSVLRGR